jgi:hypothetical protein
VQERENSGKTTSKALEEKFKKLKTRYNTNEYNIIIFDIKKKIIDILQYVINVQLDIRLSKFLQEFFNSDKDLMIDPTQSAIEIRFLSKILNGSKLTEEDEEIKKKVDDKVIKWMKRAYSNTTIDMKVMSEKDIICILLDIILYKDAVMVNSGFTLLAKYFSQKHMIIQYANDIQLL